MGSLTKDNYYPECKVIKNTNSDTRTSMPHMIVCYSEKIKGIDYAITMRYGSNVQKDNLNCFAFNNADSEFLRNILIDITGKLDR